MSYKFLSTILGIDANFTGNVGVGTTTPAYKLDVNGTTRVSSSTSASSLVFTSTTSSIATASVKVDTIGGFFRAYGSAFSVASLANKVSFGPDGADGIVVFSNATQASGSTGSISLRGGGYDSAAEMLFIDLNGSRFTNGYVLIGTSTNSGYKLDVNGTTRFRSDSVFGIGNGLMILGRNTGGGQSQSMIQFDGANGWNFAITNFASTAYLDLTNDGRFTMGNNIIYTSRDSSAVLNLVATNRGFLQPRMTTTQRNAIATPATGLSIYNTTTNTEDYYNGTAWVSLQTSITNPVTGTGTTNYVPKWTGSTALGNSLMYDNGTTLLVGTTTASTDYSSALLALSKSNNLTYQEIRGSSQATLVLTQGVTANSTTPAVEIFNGYNFGIKFIGGTGGAFSNYPLYYYAGDGAGTGDYVMMQAGGSERLRIASNGNVQIGTTTNAGYKLDVNGTTRIYGASTSSLMIDTVGTADMASSITFRQNSPNWSSSIGTHTSGGGLHYGLQFKSQPSTVNFVINRDGSTYFGGFGLANSSSLVELSSTTKGFLPPRMTSAQRTAISTPAVGLIVYQTDGVEGLYVNTSGGWKSLTMV